MQARKFDWTTALLSFFIPPLGQAARGYLGRAALLAVGLTCLGWAFFQVAVFLPPSPGSLIVIALYPITIGVGCAWDAGRLADIKVSQARSTLYGLATFGLLMALSVPVRLALNTGHSWLKSYWIPSESTLPTLQVEDYIFVDCRSSQGIQRGDVVVFHPPSRYTGDKTDLVKRVVAVGGDTVEIKDGAFWLNGQRQTEPYINEPIENEFPPHRVAENSLFMLGDNRNNSHDSRFFGDVPQENWVGRVSWIYWSKNLRRIGTATNLERKL